MDNSNKQYTPFQNFWRRFKKNTLAMVGMSLIGLYLLLAILGYLITPDATPMANRQILEISSLTPGTKIAFLKIHRNIEEESRGIINKMLMGHDDNFKYIPYNDLTLTDSTIIIEAYSPYKLDEPFYSTYALSDVVFAQTSSAFHQGNFDIKLLDGSTKNITTTSLKPQVEAQCIEKTFLLGTDRFGRDLLSRLIIGSRISLAVGFISVLISIFVGILFGATAGYFGGIIDKIIMWLVNVVWSIPTLLLVIAVTLILGKGFWQIFVAVGLTMWVEVARVVRGQVLSIREKEYIEAARAIGLSNFRIIFRHILPNAINPVIIISAANFATAILLEAGLSFLGIGVQPPMPSWGGMIKQHYGFIIMDQAYLALLPGFAILSMVIAFTWVGNGLRDALDYKSS